MNEDMNRIAKLLDSAYANLLDNFDYDFVVGTIAEAKAIAEGDEGVFDNQGESQMKQNTHELTGTALDWAVTSIEDPKAFEDGLDAWRIYRNNKTVDGFFMNRYSTVWAQGGVIIERERICLWTEGYDWEAKMQSGSGEWVSAWGATPLEASMRCYVMSKLGDEIDIPTELLERESK